MLKKNEEKSIISSSLGFNNPYPKMKTIEKEEKDWVKAPTICCLKI